VAVVALIASAPGTRQQPQSEALVARTAPIASDPTPAVNVARAVNFTSDPILMPSPLVQPVAATRSLSGYGYDTRAQPSPWRHDGSGAQRQGTAPYVYVIVPQGAGAAESQRPH
ncbi:MAG TPA: hypothetical protein VM555_04935, partial [Tahibacter sp.]|nr:hypothetical protein [Tahibacter sp.]